MSDYISIKDDRFWQILFDEACVEGKQAERIQKELEKIALDEKEIIRKAFERVLEELKKEVIIEDSLSKNSTGEIKKMHTYGRNCLNVAIKKIKECGISE